MGEEGVWVEVEGSERWWARKRGGVRCGNGLRGVRGSPVAWSAAGVLRPANEKRAKAH